MAKISLTYPETGLAVSVSVLNQATEAQEFSGTANEIGTSKTYVFTFAETASTDYVYIATATGYNAMSGSVFSNEGLTAEQAEQLDRIDSRVDIKVSDSYGIRGGITQKEPNPEWIKKLLKEHQKEMLEALDEKNKIPNIIEEEDEEETDEKSIEMMEKIDKWIAKQEEKERKEAEREKKEEKRKEKEKKDREKKEKEEIEAIANSIGEIEKRFVEMKDIQEEIDAEERKNILKLIENGHK